MSLIIFFGMALLIFIAGVIAITVTLYQWRKQRQLKSQNNIKAKTKAKLQET
ncbi:MAG: hypothetical protein H7Z71_01720 [Moraxellaceae bacterium]|nr:hypothetical protein [Pseudobdellovibrionaceae bacterium]